MQGRFYVIWKLTSSSHPKGDDPRVLWRRRTLRRCKIQARRGSYQDDASEEVYILALLDSALTLVQLLFDLPVATRDRLIALTKLLVGIPGCPASW